MTSNVRPPSARFHAPWIMWLLVITVGLPERVAGIANPWVTSDARFYGQPVPNAWSIESFHADPAFARLEPRAFCRKFFDVYYDGRRKNWRDFQVGLTLWSHTSQEPRVNPGLIELDPIVLLNVHGSGYCGIASGLQEGIYQSRPGAQPGKPAIDARRWFLGGIVHSVTDAFYDGRWHYYDIDLGGFAGDDERGVWSMADVIANPKGYYGSATTFKSDYFFRADGNGAWVEKIDPAKSYTFQDNHMLGHEMSFSLRPGETFTRYFSGEDAGWSELTPPTIRTDASMKGFSELVYVPRDATQLAQDAVWRRGNTLVLAVRSPYNITSSRVESTGTVSYSLDLGRNWLPLPADGFVTGAVNRWDYLLKIEDGVLERVTTRGMLHPGSLPRVGPEATTMTVASMADYDVLTWIPDWSTPEALADNTRVEGLSWRAQPNVAFSGGQVAGTGSLTVPVKAPPGTRIVKLSACAIGGMGTTPDSNKWIELHLGPAGDTSLVERTTDCSPWGLKPETRIEHWQSNVSGSRRFDPCTEAEVKLVCQGWGHVRGLRIHVGYVRETPPAASGTLVITHGYDGKTFSREVPAADLAKDPVRYTVPEGATRNNFIKMAVP